MICKERRPILDTEDAKKILPLFLNRKGYQMNHINPLQYGDSWDRVPSSIRLMSVQHARMTVFGLEGSLSLLASDMVHEIYHKKMLDIGLGDKIVVGMFVVPVEDESPGTQQGDR